MSVCVIPNILCNMFQTFEKCEEYQSLIRFSNSSISPIVQLELMMVYLHCLSKELVRNGPGIHTYGTFTGHMVIDYVCASASLSNG